MHTAPRGDDDARRYVRDKRFDAREGRLDDSYRGELGEDLRNLVHERRVEEDEFHLRGRIADELDALRKWSELGLLGDIGDEHDDPARHKLDGTEGRILCHSRRGAFWRKNEVASVSMGILDDDAVDEALTKGAWHREGKEIIRVVERADFAGALAFVNEVGLLAEGANHHPDIDIRWNRVTLRLSTHSEGGITDKDLSLAAAIDDLD